MPPTRRALRSVRSGPAGAPHKEGPRAQACCWGADAAAGVWAGRRPCGACLLGGVAATGPHLGQGQHEDIIDVVGDAPRQVGLAVGGLGGERLEGGSSTRAAARTKAAAVHRGRRLLLHRAPQEAGASRQHRPHKNQAPQPHVGTVPGTVWTGGAAEAAGRQRKATAAAVSGPCPRGCPQAEGFSQEWVGPKPRMPPRRLPEYRLKRRPALKLQSSELGRCGRV